ncbi:MAG: hypothetical protein H0U54_04900, partial [Acidobacteria bacterium]|nr:hypothetical protein [Acidobacteriota bacterium]
MTTGESKQSLSGDESRGNAALAPLPTDLRGADFLFNRELSLLEFHRRVLEEALDESQPLLERLKFLSIFSTNVDELFMIRVSGLKEALEEDVQEVSPDGMTITEQLKAIKERLMAMVAEQMRCLREDILPGLKSEGVEIVP